MASYTDLYDISDEPTLLVKMAFAIAVAAENIRAEPVTTPNHVARVAWAKTVLSDPLSQAKRGVWLALAQNRSFTTTQILGSSDAAVQGVVDGMIDLLA